MCLYFDENTNCPHPECIYIDNVKSNFGHDFEKNRNKLSQIELKYNWSETYKENKLKASENDKKQSHDDRYETKRDKKATPFAEKKPMNGEEFKKLEISQLIDSDLKILLNQNVADFIFQMSTKFAQNLKIKNKQDEQRLQNLEKRLQNLREKICTEPNDCI